MKRYLSSTVTRSCKISGITVGERKILDQTSIGLYRILSRIIKIEGKRNDYILLQPPLNHRDYGQARMLDSKDAIIWRDTKVLKDDDEIWKKILRFCKTWTKKEDEVEDKVIGDFDKLFGISQANEENGKEGSGVDANDDDVLVPEEFTLYVPHFDLKRALRHGFHSHINIENELTKKQLLDMQRFAIDSIKLLEDQRKMWERTSISIDKERGIRVIATSRCIGVNPAGQRAQQSGTEVKNWFAYRIRVDNFNEPGSDKSTTFQLLGRTWRIVEEDENEDVKLGSLVNKDESYKSKEFNVDAPKNGVVGYLPVIKPGETFEYMSGCGLSTLIGTMSGCLHMAIVDEDTEPAHVGDPISAFDLPKERRFEMKVLPLKMIANHS